VTIRGGGCKVVCPKYQHDLLGPHCPYILEEKKTDRYKKKKNEQICTLTCELENIEITFKKLLGGALWLLSLPFLCWVDPLCAHMD
jgi:hypothetical protein